MLVFFRSCASLFYLEPNVRFQQQEEEQGTWRKSSWKESLVCFRDISRFESTGRLRPNLKLSRHKWSRLGNLTFTCAKFLLNIHCCFCLLWGPPSLKWILFAWFLEVGKRKDGRFVDLYNGNNLRSLWTSNNIGWPQTRQAPCIVCCTNNQRCYWPDISTFKH